MTRAGPGATLPGDRRRPPTPPRWKQAALLLVANAIVFLVAFGALEIGLYAALYHPQHIPGRLHGLFRGLYQATRDWIQYNPECARYDPEVSYTLRPGSCTFSSFEFSTSYHVNRLGLRDDETSLDGPAIVVLGDSNAMGWGVQQDQAFPQILEHHTGQKVLNAAVSSYGTARQLMMLGRIDSRRLRILVIQYCDNDLGENEWFLYGEDGLNIMDPSTYDALVKYNESTSRYRFGRFTAQLLRRLGEKITGRQPVNLRNLPIQESPGVLRTGEAYEAKVFLEVLARSPVDLSGVEIVVLELNPYANNDSRFIDMLEKLVAREREATAKLALTTVDMSKTLKPEHYYRLDDHLRPVGHQVVAEAVLRTSAFAAEPRSSANTSAR